MVKTAFITGITGQDGSYLAEFLLSKGYEVHGMIRRSSSPNTSRIDHISAKVCLHFGDMTDSEQINRLIAEIKPDECYNLAAQSHVGISFDTAEYTGNVTGLGTTRLLNAIKNFSPETKFYQASSSEIFGNAPAPQGIETPLSPRSPYACAKAYAYYMVKNYREGHGLFAVNGIAFNHESPRRGEQFVTRKITQSVARILAGTQKKIVLGNLDAERDWGFAPDYVKAMWLTLNTFEPRDYVIGTGQSTSVWVFLSLALGYANLPYDTFITTSNTNRRPLDVRELRADPFEIRSKVGWGPDVYIEDLVKIMVDADMRAEGLKPIGYGDAAVRELYPDKWWTGD